MHGERAPFYKSDDMPTFEIAWPRKHVEWRGTPPATALAETGAEFSSSIFFLGRGP